MADRKDTGRTGDVVQKKKPRGKPGPTFGDNGLTLEPGDNTKYLAFAMAVHRLPAIDPADGEQVAQRIDEYFTLCMDMDTKPAVSGLAMALGVDRRTLWEWKTGRTRLLTHGDAVKKAYGFLEILWEEYMLNGKINPVSGIFLGKNNYDYVDKTEHVLTPNNPLGELPSEEELDRQIAALPPPDDLPNL